MHQRRIETITSITAERAFGTFTFSAEPVPSTGATCTKLVPQGKFDVAY
jgi:hypothetical protein